MTKSSKPIGIDDLVSLVFESKHLPGITGAERKARSYQAVMLTFASTFDEFSYNSTLESACCLSDDVLQEETMREHPWLSSYSIVAKIDAEKGATHFASMTERLFDNPAAYYRAFISYSTLRDEYRNDRMAVDIPPISDEVLEELLPTFQNRNVLQEIAYKSAMKGDEELMLRLLSSKNRANDIANPYLMDLLKVGSDELLVAAYEMVLDGIAERGKWKLELSHLMNEKAVTTEMIDHAVEKIKRHPLAFQAMKNRPYGKSNREILTRYFKAFDIDEALPYSWRLRVFLAHFEEQP